MEKVDLKYHSLDFNDIYKRINDDPLGNKIIKELNVDEKLVKDNFEMFDQYININKSCLTCKNKNDCKHDSKGYCYGLKIDNDGYLTDYYYICKLYKDYYLRKNNLLISSFSEDELLDDNLKDFMFDNIRMLDENFIKRVIKIKQNENISGALLTIKDPKIRLKLIKSLSYSLLTNKKVAVIKFSDLLQTIKSEFKSNTNTLSIVSQAEVLIIDGLGNESITTWSRDEILMGLLDDRISKEMPTILSSEYELEELKKIYKLNYNDEAKVSQLCQKISIIMLGD